MDIDFQYHLPKSKPRDVLTRINFFTAKEKVMFAAKRSSILPEPVVTSKLYADLSKTTMDTQRQLATITKPLQNNHIPYKWGFPVKLLITYQSKTYIVKSLKRLRDWCLIPEETTSSDNPSSSQMDTDWSLQDA